MNSNEFNIFRLIIEQQNSHYTTLITVIIAFFIAIIGFNWFINRKLLIHQMNNHIKDEAEKVKVSLLKTIDTKFQIKEKQFENSFTYLHYKMLTTTGLTLIGQKNYVQALDMFFEVLKLCIELNDELGIGASIELIEDCIKHLIEEKTSELINVERYKETVNKIPVLRNTDSLRILVYLNVCKTKEKL